MKNNAQTKKHPRIIECASLKALIPRSQVLLMCLGSLHMNMKTTVLDNFLPDGGGIVDVLVRTELWTAVTIIGRVVAQITVGGPAGSPPSPPHSTPCSP